MKPSWNFSVCTCTSCLSPCSPTFINLFLWPWLLMCMSYPFWSLHCFSHNWQYHLTLFNAFSLMALAIPLAPDINQSIQLNPKKNFRLGRKCIFLHIMIGRIKNQQKGLFWKMFTKWRPEGYRTVVLGKGSRKLQERGSSSVRWFKFFFFG